MQLFYNPSLCTDSTEMTFNKIESRHIIKVLRKKEGDSIHITNGKNYLFTGKIIHANDKRCKIQIKDITFQKSNRKHSFSIAIAPTKNISRYEWLLEKATEIGIDHIYPIICEHSERKIIKHDRLDKVLQTALKQSLQFKLPILHELKNFKDLINELNAQEQTNQLKYIAQCEIENPNEHLFQNKIKKGTDTLILIGPEGGFSPNEIAFALQNSFNPVSLGTNRLRTETAGIVAIHTISLVNNQ